MAAALLLTAFVLPSSLNVPQTDPTQTLEYAPVPPSDEDAPPVGGNAGSLGLGGSNGLTGDGLGGSDGLPPPPPLVGTGTVPRQKRCVGSPPKQTEDPLAPPCVAFFEGDNFGRTYAGVEPHEIRVLVYMDDACISATSRGQECPEKNSLNDLDQPPAPNEFVNDRGLRAFVRFFNERFQTYGRRVHMWVYHAMSSSPPNPAPPEQRRADAASLYDRVRPFAEFNYSGSYVDEFLIAMAQRGVLNFGSRGVRQASFYQKYPGLIWSYLPSLEQQVKNYVDFVCTQVVPYPVVASGNEGENGKPRRLGLLHTTDAARPDLHRFAELAKKGIERCGGKFWADATYPQVNAVSSGPNKTPAATAMARFKAERVSTIIWPQGYETENSKAAANAQYYPEWVIAGDGQLDGFGPGLMQDQDVWDRHAFTTTALGIVGRLEDTPCWRALRESDPSIPDGDMKIYCGLRPYYEDLRQLFTGIQVAGPRLMPRTIDEGFHAIPPRLSSNPNAPACYYEIGDYTCVKDVATAWWDRTATSTQNTPGCYRLIEGGRRYPAGKWPKRNGLAVMRPDNPCSSYQGGVGNVRAV